MEIHFGCSCSRERSARAIRALGEKEVKQLFLEQPSLQVDCHFCGQVYQYDYTDLEWLLSDQPPGSDITMKTDESSRYDDLTVSELIEHALALNEGQLSAKGALVVSPERKHGSAKVYCQ